MRIRSDFVSNSSSCSFVLSSETGTVKDAMRFFAKTFGECCLPYDIGDRVTVGVTSKNKWFKELYERLTFENCGWKDYYEDWSTGKIQKKDPEEVGYDSISVPMDRLFDLDGDEWALSRIDGVRFQCEDSDPVGLLYLRLLYAFFERNRFCPDATSSEHSFVGAGSDDEFMTKLVTTCGGGKADGNG